jgi:transcriptional/translational regulatory protein YebC/TACO1
VQTALVNGGYEVREADLAMNATNKTEISADDARKLVKLLDRLEDLDDVQDTYINVDLPEDLE